MQVYSAVSGVLTGHYFGVDALGGISAATASFFQVLILTMLLGLVRGFAVPMRNAYGADDFARIHRLLWPGLLLGLLLSGISSAILLPFGD